MTYRIRPIGLLAVIAAAVVAGAVLTGTLEMSPRLAATKRDAAPAAPAGPTLTIPSFADIAQGALTSVVSITSTEIDFESTVTVGVVSAKERRGLSDNPNSASLQNFIQTDAAINFGNSGPLINVGGQVVGIATMVVRPAQNIGFAVPINMAKAILPQLEQRGKVTRGLLGVSARNVDQDIQQAFRLPSADGAFVESVSPDLPAAKAGIKPGDTIVKVDDMPVKTTRDLIDYVSSKAPGQKVRVTLLRDSRTVSATVTLIERESEEKTEARPAAERGRSRDKLGLAVSELTPDLRRQLGIGSGVSGVIVEDVREVSPAGDQGLAPGDVITEVNGKAVRSVSQFHDEVGRVKKGDYLRLYVLRFVPQQLARYVLIPVDW